MLLYFMKPLKTTPIYYDKSETQDIFSLIKRKQAEGNDVYQATGYDVYQPADDTDRHGAAGAGVIQRLAYGDDIGCEHPDRSHHVGNNGKAGDNAQEADEPRRAGES